MAVYTAFCQEPDGAGTTWIGPVGANDIEQAKRMAIAICASDWCVDESDVRCVGIAEGEINILYWEEAWEQE